MWGRSPGEITKWQVAQNLSGFGSRVWGLGLKVILHRAKDKEEAASAAFVAGHLGIGAPAGPLGLPVPCQWFLMWVLVCACPVLPPLALAF